MLATLLHEVLRHDHDQVALLERLSQGNPMNVAELGELVSRTQSSAMRLFVAIPLILIFENNLWWAILSEPTSYVKPFCIFFTLCS